MRKITLLSAFLGLVVLVAAPARADVLTFEGLSNGNPIPNGYGGLNWNNFYTLDTSSYTPSGYVNGVVSGTMVAYNAYGDPADTMSVDGVTPFTFNSAYLTAAWNDGLNVDITGYNGATLLYSTTVVLNTSGPTHVVLDWAGITSLNFTSYGGVNHGYNGGGEHFAMDDFVYNGAIGTPEPSTLAIAGLGGVLLVGYKLRRRRAAA